MCTIIFNLHIFYYDLAVKSMFVYNTYKREIATFFQFFLEENMVLFPAGRYSHLIALSG